MLVPAGGTAILRRMEAARGREIAMKVAKIAEVMARSAIAAGGRTCWARAGGARTIVEAAAVGAVSILWAIGASIFGRARWFSCGLGLWTMRGRRAHVAVIAARWATMRWFMIGSGMALGCAVAIGLGVG